ncbi:Superoxide dismutase [Cu-Zn] 2 [Olea europaea subsp. europaea]|uniref:Superoxide dismutase [Cu-Zn] 2 n=1 Tax=Olea europaea subsp. europaea TaxID=158383 RepID=A0A8S0SC00_OLEEU|nr:Superoxide dismutase [Cu-Zn] 2 [Olea europaea subsp. europaea]
MAKKACLEEDGSEGWFSDKSDESEYAYPFGADLLDEYAKGASDNMEEDSFSYGSLAYANYAEFETQYSNLEEEEADLQISSG